MEYKIKYWKDSIEAAAEDCGLSLTEEQAVALAESIRISYENYSMAFHEPSSIDRFEICKSEFEHKLNQKELELENYRNNAELAIKRAFNLPKDAQISVANNSDILLVGGRTKVL